MVMRTKRPPRISSSSSVRDRIARPESRPPRASEPVSPMKIWAGEAFHQRKPKHAPDAAGGDHGEVERVRDRRSSAAPAAHAAGVAELPDADDDVRPEHHHAGAGRQPVQPVGEVHAVGRRDDHGEHPDDERPAGRTTAVSRTNETAREAGDSPRVVLEPQREQPEDDGDDDLSTELDAGPDAGAALPEDLDVVVDEPHGSEAGHEEQHEQPGRRTAPASCRGARRIADERAADDHHATHRRGAALVVVGRVVAVGLVADRLARSRGD